MSCKITSISESTVKPMSFKISMTYTPRPDRDRMENLWTDLSVAPVSHTSIRAIVRGNSLEIMWILWPRVSKISGPFCCTPAKTNGWEPRMMLEDEFPVLTQKFVGTNTRWATCTSYPQAKGHLRIISPIFTIFTTEFGAHLCQAPSYNRIYNDRLFFGPSLTAIRESKPSQRCCQLSRCMNHLLQSPCASRPRVDPMEEGVHILHHKSPNISGT